MIGTLLGHYQILAELGRGGMGQVYLAQDVRLQRKVALKMLPPGLVTDPAWRKRFDRESHALAALNHVNVVTIHAVEEEGGQPFLVMELVQGTSLEALMAGSRLTLERWLGLAVQIVEGVAATHRAGIVHRDLKPGNIMVREDGVVKVVDFGISKTEAETVIDGVVSGNSTGFQTAPGVAIGTLPYMSPQQLEGRPPDVRSDLYSLGVILYEMATGYRPFQGTSPASLISSILRDPPLDLPRTGVPLPPAMTSILDRCLAKDPAHRFQSAEELREALVELRRRVLQGDSSALARPIGALAPGAAGSEATLLSLPAPSPTASPASLPGRRPLPWRRLALGGAGALVLLALLATLFRPRAAVPGNPASAPPKSAAPEKVISLAVLPLRNLSGNPDQEYFSDGTTEAIIGSLAKIGGLRISSGTSVRHFKDAALTLPQIAKELGVSYILEGSVSRIHDRLRIHVQLVDAAHDAILWTNAYERRIEDIFEVQNEVAAAVAQEARGELTPSDRTRLSEIRVASPEVYDLYLKASFLLSKRSQETTRQALGLLDQATARDPNYAPAWAAKANAYVLLISFGLAVMPTQEGLPKAREAALRALTLDPHLSEAQSLLGVIEIQSWNWRQAEERFRRALELNPSNADAYLRSTQLLTIRGEHRQAVEALQKALQLDPLSAPAHTTAAANYFFAGRYQDCIAEAQRILELQPGSWGAHLFLGGSFSALGDDGAAETQLREAVRLGGNNPFALGALGEHLAGSGHREEARKILAELERRSKTEYVAASLPAKLYFLLGQPDQGFAWMDKAFAERDHSVSFLKVDPTYRSVRSDPRYQRLLERLGLS